MQDTPQLHFLDGAAARIAYFTWGPGDADPLVLIHATGFHARVWDRTIAHLARRYRVIAPDMRGHGRSGRTGPIASWREPVSDLAELCDHLDLAGAVGVGHSMGGHCLVHLAAAKPARFRQLVLIDPVIMAPEIYRQGAAHLRGIASVEEHPVARRKNDWRDWREMFDRFRDRHPYSLWDRAVLEDYCRHGVVPRPDGAGYELACPPEIEASVYLAHASVDIHRELGRIDAPVTVVRARERPLDQAAAMDFTVSPTWPQLADRFARGRDIYRPDLTHFIPMQDPAFTAALIDEVSAGEPVA